MLVSKTIVFAKFSFEHEYIHLFGNAGQTKTSQKSWCGHAKY